MEKTPLKHKSILPAIFVLMGAGSVITQSILFREMLVIFYGSELILGFILSSWLFSIAVGAYCFNILSDKIRSPEKLLIVPAVIYSLAPSILIPLVRNSRCFTGTGQGLLIPFFKTALLSSAFTFLPGFLTGFLFPLGCSIIKDAGGLSTLYVMESAGALAGGVLFSVFLCGYLPAPTTAASVSFLFTVAIILHMREYRILPDTYRRAVGAVLLIVSSVLFFGSWSIDRITVESRWKSLAGDMPLLASTDSPYQNLALTKAEEQYSVYFNGLYGYSFPDPYSEAVTAHHLLTQCENPEKILVIGEITPDFAEEVLKEEQVKKLTVVYIDRKLNEMIQPFYDAKAREVMKDPRISTFYADGRAFLENPGEGFDLIYLKVPEPSTAAANRFYTVQFFRLAKKSLRAGGVLALPVTSSENYLGGDLLDYNGTVYNSLRRVFPKIIICPSTPAYFFATSAEGPATDDWNLLFKRFENRKVRETIFSPYLFETLYDRDRIKFITDALNKSRAPENTDLSPAAYLYGIKLWDSYSDSRLSPFIDFIHRSGLRPWLVIPAVFLILSLIFSFVRKTGHRLNFSVIYAAGATGFTAMGLSLMLIYFHQSISGCLYRDMALLTALFMSGLVAGGISAGKAVKGKFPVRTWFLAILFILSVFCGILPSALEFLSRHPNLQKASVFLLMILSGFLSGHILPLSGALLSSENHGGKTAGRLWSADHLGGALGAILMGAFLVPILGMATVCGLLMIIQITAFTACSISMRFS